MGKSSARKSGMGRDRAVYVEFGSPPATDATERPEVPPSQQTLKIQASRKGRKGKTVTVVTGFQLSPQSLQGLAKKLKAHCGTGGTVKDLSIEIQGDHRSKIQTFLDSMGYKTKISGG